MELSRIRAVFFSAMRAGYAGEGALKAHVPGMPGHKEIRHEYEDDLLVVDRWYGNDSGKSAGTTTIYHKERPVWVMNYGGVYPKECIPFLKQALRSAYATNKWSGGRGPSVLVFPDSALIYRNMTEINGFARFKGHELILGTERRSTRTLGYHDYWGMSLI